MRFGFTILINYMGMGTKMQLTKEQKEEFENAAKPLIKFLNDRCHPHTIVQVDQVSAELLESQVTFITQEFVKD